MDLKRQLAIRLRTIRKARGLSQDEVAALIERSVDAISNIERGKSLPSLETLCALAIKLDLPLADFIGPLPRTKASAKRVALLTELSELARQLSDKELSIAVKQVAAFIDEKR